MERDAKYATVALFALACIAAAVAFIWWYSGRGDQREYANYEIYFEGTVSGLAQGSPVRYLGVDVGRVTSLAVDTKDARRVKVVAEIDTTAPISGATLAKLGLLGLTGLLYIDLQQDPRVSVDRPLPVGDAYPIIAARKGTIEASIEQLPRLLGQAAEVLAQIERVLADQNVNSIGRTLANIERASADLPTMMADARALAADLRKVSAETLALTTNANQALEKARPDLEAVLENARITSEKLSRTADGLDGLMNNGDGAFGRVAGSGLNELQQLVIDARAASNEVSELARSLRERPTSLVLEQPENGVEIAR